MAPIVNRLGQALDLEEGARVGRLVRAVNKECWWNAVRGLRRAYRRIPNAYYVEGWGLHLVATEHAWLEVGGRIVDPTPAWQDVDTPPLYFPAERFTRLDLLGLKPSRFPRHPWGGRKSEPHIRAMVACHAELFKVPVPVIRRHLNLPPEPTP